MQIVTAEPITEPEPPPRRFARPRPDISFHVALLGISFAVIVLSVMLRVEGEREVVLPLVNVPLPGVCTSQRLFGLNCPGCGLTRSFVSLGHGNLPAAWHFNPAGILGFLLVAMQIPYRSIQWFRVRRGLPELRLKWIGELFFWFFFAALLIQWVVRMIAS